MGGLDDVDANSRLREPKPPGKRDVPLMYCGRCGSPLKQFGRLSRRRHAARCDFDRERNLAGLRDPQKRARMFAAFGESAVYVMATILGARPHETQWDATDQKANGARVRTVWMEDGVAAPAQASPTHQNL
jgi:hypothetical protein